MTKSTMTQIHPGDPGEILTTTGHMKIKSKVGMSGMNQDTAEITTGHNTNIKTGRCSTNTKSTSDFSIVSFSCHGFKSSYGSIMELMKSTDMLFLSETWLKPCELCTVSNDMVKAGFWPNFKSSIDPETILEGRPYGGVGIICKKVSGLTYIPLKTENDRILSLQIRSRERILVTIIGVYMPHFNGSASQTAEYYETLEDIQCIIGCNDPSPVIFLGDMNASLPQSLKLPRNWHKKLPFNSNSFLLYDFLCQNDFVSCNFRHAQQINYTYSRNNTFSYIDHVFCSRYFHQSVTDCSILHDTADIVSDHLPMHLLIRLQVESKSKVPEDKLVRFNQVYPRLDWSNENQSRSFAQHVTELAATLPNVDLKSIITIQDAKLEVNRLCDAVQEVLHKAAGKVTDEISAPQSTGKRSWWWNSDCTYTRDKQRFWHKVWASAGRPRSGHVYHCYKHAKKTYRNACRHAVNSRNQKHYRQLDYYLVSRNMKKFWNLVRHNKTSSQSSTSDINLNTLCDFYTKRFSQNTKNTTKLIKEAETVVTNSYMTIKDKVNKHFVLSEADLKNYLSKLRTGCAAGSDGICAEHLKLASETKVISAVCNILTLCIQFGIVADSFTQGLLIPLLKKTNIDPTNPKNYRPIVISTTFSKLLEIHILQESGEHEFHDLQFGFIGNRGTSMAAALTHDVLDYCTANKSPVYLCALDAESAFDGIPHAVMFQKALKVVPPLLWRILVYWYSQLTVIIKWGNVISNPISVSIGTRQ